MCNIMSKGANQLINENNFEANEDCLGFKVMYLYEAVEAVETAEEELLEKIKFAYQEECPDLMTGRYNRCDRTISKPCDMECDYINNFINKIKNQ